MIEGLTEGAAERTQRVTVLHELMERIGRRIAYKTGVSTVDTTAIEALARGGIAIAGEAASLGLRIAGRAAAAVRDAVERR